MYKIFRNILFTLNPEKIHNLSFGFIRILGASKILRNMISRTIPTYPNLNQTISGINFKSPIGLAAGFDKNARALNSWYEFGFGFAEIGTVTFQAQNGNPKPRMFRLKKDKALINRMGFNNNGIGSISSELLKIKRDKYSIPIGVNIGKSKITPLEDAPKEYMESAKMITELSDFIIINVSSPNTPNLRELQTINNLEKIINELLKVVTVPVFIKIAPDLSDKEILDITDLILDKKLAGIVATNTTITRNNLKTPDETINKIGAGGLSGSPLFDNTLRTIKMIYQRTQGKCSIIAVGGIFTPDQAWEVITQGANLVEGYTGFIYEGPNWARNISKQLSKKVKSANLENISLAVGSRNQLN